MRLDRLGALSRGRWVAVGAGAALLLGGCVPLTPFSTIEARLPPERLIQVQGGPVHVERHGSGPPVVLVHGFGASSYSWREVAARLEGSFHVVSLDLAGFGWTRRPEAKEEYTRFAQGERTLRVLDALGLERVHLVGHSYGGAVATALVAREPARFETLTLVDTAGPRYTQLRRSRLAALRPLASLYVRLWALRPGRVARGLRRSMADDDAVDERLVTAYLERLRVEGAPRAFWGLTAPVEDPQGEVRWSQLELPVHVVWGELDELVTLDTARREAARIPCSVLTVLEGVGHLPMEESPADLARAMRGFFDEETRPACEPPAATLGGREERAQAVRRATREK